MVRRVTYVFRLIYTCVSLVPAAGVKFHPSGTENAFDISVARRGRNNKGPQRSLGRRYARLPVGRYSPDDES